MTFLADLIGGGDISDDAASAAAKMNLNLFGDDGSDAGGGGGDAQSQVRLYARRAQACFSLATRQPNPRDCAALAKPGMLGALVVF